MNIVLLLAALIYQPGEGLFRSESPRQTTGWLGLYCSETCALSPASLEYRLDERDRDRLTSETRPRGALVVFRDVPGLAAGPVPEAPFENEELRRGAVVPLVLGGERYELRVTAADDYLHGAVVTLRHGGAAQAIFRMPEFVDEPHLSLRFAGDLDGDGKLDLIMSNSPKYSYSPLQLYLSGAAGPGELVREVVKADRHGC